MYIRENGKLRKFGLTEAKQALLRLNSANKTEEEYYALRNDLRTYAMNNPYSEICRAIYKYLCAEGFEMHDIAGAIIHFIEVYEG